MNAAFIDRYGSNDRVGVADIAVPLMGPLDLIVQVHAASVNPLDVKREITRLVESGVIKPLVDKVFPLEQVRDALAYSESGRATGKVVIKVA